MGETPPAAPTVRARRPTLKRLLLASLALFVMYVIGAIYLCACDFRSASTRIEARRLVAMKFDLRNLYTAEESYFADHVTYTTSLSSLRFTPSAGVTVTIGSATGFGWSATAKHDSTTRICGIFVGRATAPVSGQSEGEPRCQE